MKLGASLSHPLGLGKLLKSSSNIVPEYLVDCAKRIREMGFCCAEIPADLFFLIPQLLSDNTIKALSSLDIRYTAHLPFIGIDLSSTNEHIRSAGVKSVIEAARVIEPLSCLSYVLHIANSFEEEIFRWNLKEKVQGYVTSIILTQATKSLEELLTYLPADRLCLETMETLPVTICLELAKKFRTRICLDTGHYAMNNFSGVSEFIKIHSSLLGEVHLNGFMKRRLAGRMTLIEDHISLNDNMGFDEIYNAIVETGFDGPLIMEMPENHLMASLTFLKENGYFTSN
ncbi:MAG: TIM barrel protein [Thermoplasmata archaeon]